MADLLLLHIDFVVALTFGVLILFITTSHCWEGCPATLRCWLVSHAMCGKSEANYRVFGVGINYVFYFRLVESQLS